MRRFLTDRHHVQWCLVFSLDGALVSATPNCGSGIVYEKIVCYSCTAWFPTAVLKTWCRNILLFWVSKLHPEGSVKDSKPQGRPFSAPTPDNLARERDSVLLSPHRSARRQALALGLNEFSFRRILHKDLHYYPHKIQVAQELSEWDKVSRLQFCNEILDL